VAIAVGNLLPVKRIDRFLAALRLARLRSPDLRGVVVGDGPERQRLEATAAELGLLPDGIAFLGSRDDVPGLLRQADMLVLSSEHEGFPNAVLEAMGARLPVVATRCGDVERIVADGVTGFVVPPDDVEGMAERMSALAGSLELRRRLGEAGRAVAERTYASWRLAGRLQETYQAIAERRRRARLAAALA
jgi:glycosyltransferase involved in cell wall biosynthesis